MSARHILSAFAMQSLPLTASNLIMTFVSGDAKNWKRCFDKVIAELNIQIEYIALDLDVQETLLRMPEFLVGRRHVCKSKYRPHSILYELNWQQGIGPRTIRIEFRNGKWGLETYRFFYSHQSRHIPPIMRDEYGCDDRCIMHFDQEAFWYDVKAEMAFNGLVVQ